MQRVQTTIENHPILGWLASAVGVFTGWLQWVMDHSDDFAKVVGLFTALIGFVVAYFTLRIQHRHWKKLQDADRRADADRKAK